MFVPLCTKFSLPNGLHMFTAWEYWFSLVHANYRLIVTYKPDQGNRLCTLEVRAKLVALWERQKRWEFPPPNGRHEQSYWISVGRHAVYLLVSMHGVTLDWADWALQPTTTCDQGPVTNECWVPTPPHPTLPPLFRDWSLITGREGGATKWEKCGSQTFCVPPRLFAPPPPPLLNF